MEKQLTGSNGFRRGTGINIIKRFICLIIAALVLCMAGCSGTQTDHGGTDATPDGPGGTPGSDEPEIWQADESRLEAARNAAGKNELLIGCWIPPRPAQMKTQEDADARMAELAASGINCVSTHNSDLSSLKFIGRLCEAAAKYGVKVIIELNRDLSRNGIRNNVRIVEKTMDYEAVIGYNMFDEPVASMASDLAAEYAAIREVTGDSKIIMINLLPNYGSKDTMAPQITEGLTWYQTYLDTFAGDTTDALSFDFYPFSEKSSRDVGRIKSMMQNLSDIAIIARKYDLPAWGFVQNSSWNGMRAPNAEELAFLSHLHLIFGLESYSYFLYAETSNGAEGDFSAMLTHDNKLTDMYYRVQNNNIRMKNAGYRFLSYSLKGFLTDKFVTDAFSVGVNDALKLEGDNDLASWEAERDTLLGVFEGRSEADNSARGYAVDNADKGYYLLNFDSANAETVTLRFESATPYTVWGPDGIEAMGVAKEVTVELGAYDGKFVELRTFGD